jgi:TonB family protein
MLQRVVIFFVAVSVFVAPECSAAHGDAKIVASAIDVHGKRHIGTRKGFSEPWMRDRIGYTALEYPYYQDRGQRHEGDGLFRIFIDLKSGWVAHVEVVTSTGFASLDDYAVDTLRKWRWKRQTWKQVDLPIRFTAHGR